MLRTNIKLRHVKRLADKIKYQQKIEYNKKKSNFPVDMTIVRDWKKNPDRRKDFLL
jgi:predicted component of type VI protein secretion system